MFKRVLLCYDGTEAGRRALKRGAELAILLGAQVHVLSTIPNSAVDPVLAAAAVGHVCLFDSSGEYRRLLDQSIEWLRGRGVVAQGSLTTGDTLDQIVTYTQRMAIDLIVLGHYPRPAGGFWWAGPLRRASLAERVKCCVFVAVSAENDEASVGKSTK
jgi:nucleotide-binding universal stress UspA family protein